MHSKTLVILSLSLALLLGTALISMRAFNGSPHSSVNQGRTSDASLQSASAADRQIISAQAVIKQAPSAAKGYNLLAAGYMQKAREAEDFSFNKQAEQALDRSFEVAPDNYDALKLRAKLMLTFHRFEEGLEVARQAQAVSPSDHDNYGAMTDAFVELGEYPAAVEAAQKMVDLRPDTSSYARISYLRSLHGDTKGAVEAMRLAAQSANPQDSERLAWCHVQLGEALLTDGERAAAAREFDRALFFFPGYGAALDAKARILVASGDLEGAIEVHRKEYELKPGADTALALGDLYKKLGRTDKANTYYAAFESLERENATLENDMHHLVLYWLDHDQNLDEALALARKERERRKDVFTCDTLAWALYKKGQFGEAKKASDEALRLGTRDSRFLYHAGMIAQALGQRDAAAKYLLRALAINPSFDVLQADIARRTLVTRST